MTRRVLCAVLTCLFLATSHPYSRQVKPVLAGQVRLHAAAQAVEPYKRLNAQSETIHMYIGSDNAFRGQDLSALRDKACTYAADLQVGSNLYRIEASLGSFSVYYDGRMIAEARDESGPWTVQVLEKDFRRHAPPILIHNIVSGSFIDLSSNLRITLRVSYNLTFELERYRDRNTRKDQPGDYANISMFSQLTAGTDKCLAGEYTFDKQRIGLWVLDYDLDGRFTPEDRVKFSYFYELLPLGQACRIPNPKKFWRNVIPDNKHQCLYRFELKQESGEYLLQILPG